MTVLKDCNSSFYLENIDSLTQGDGDYCSHYRSAILCLQFFVFFFYICSEKVNFITYNWSSESKPESLLITMATTLPGAPQFPPTSTLSGGQLGSIAAPARPQVTRERHARTLGPITLFPDNVTYNLTYYFQQEHFKDTF